MKEESLPYEHTISLRLRHPTARLDDCTRQFGLEPLRLWSVGDPRTTPRATPLPGVWPDSYWTAAIETIEGETLTDSLERIVGWLEQHSIFLAENSRSGGSSAIFIGFFLNGFNGGFSLVPALLFAFAKLGVTLEFHVYGPSNLPHAP